jgi:hypothetical protein
LYLFYAYTMSNKETMADISHQSPNGSNERLNSVWRRGGNEHESSEEEEEE